MTRSGLFISAESRPVASSSRKVWTDCRSSGRTCSRISPRGGPERQSAIASDTVDAGTEGHSGARRITSVSRHPATHRTGRDHAIGGRLEHAAQSDLGSELRQRSAASGGASGTMHVELRAAHRDPQGGTSPPGEASRTKPTTRVHRRPEALGSRAGDGSSVGSGSRPDPTSRRRAVVRAGRSRTRPGWPSASTRRPGRGRRPIGQLDPHRAGPVVHERQAPLGVGIEDDTVQRLRGPPSVRGKDEGQRHGREDPGDPASLRSGSATRVVTSLVSGADLVPAVAPTRTGQTVYSRAGRRALPSLDGAGVGG